MLVPLPERRVAFVVLGSELSLRFSGPGQLAVILTTLVCAGVDAIMRTHPAVYPRSLFYTATFWVLPGLLTLAGLTLLNDMTWWVYRMVLIGLTGMLLAFVMVLQFRSIDPAVEGHPGARLALNVVVYIAALILFIELYGARLRSVVSATGILAASGALALERLRDAMGYAGGKARRTWLYAGVIAILMGETTWALNYCGIDSRLGGAFLLLIFYVLTGLAQQYLWQRLDRRAVIEFIALCAVGTGALFRLAL